MEYHLRMADVRDRERVAALYHSLLGTPGCTWVEEYPTLEEVDLDLAENLLFCFEDEAGTLVGVATLDQKGERDATAQCDPWDHRMKKPCELCRVGVALEVQNQGVGRRMLEAALAQAKARGFDWVQLLVSPENPGAVALYRRLGFVKCGEADLYGTHWWCMQKEL